MPNAYGANLDSQSVDATKLYFIKQVGNAPAMKWSERSAPAKADIARCTWYVSIVPTCDKRSDLHLISARANSLELLDRISGAEFLIFARQDFFDPVRRGEAQDSSNTMHEPQNLSTQASLFNLANPGKRNLRATNGPSAGQSWGRVTGRSAAVGAEAWPPARLAT